MGWQKSDKATSKTPRKVSSKALFTWVWTNFCTDKNLHSLTSCLHWTAGTGQIFEWLSVQVWDLKKAGQLFDWHGSIFIWTRVNTRTMQLIAQIARLRPGIKCCNWFKICTDPCKHHCNRICTEMGSKCQATVSLPKQSVNQVLDM